MVPTTNIIYFKNYLSSIKNVPINVILQPFKLGKYQKFKFFKNYYAIIHFVILALVVLDATSIQSLVGFKIDLQQKTFFLKISKIRQVNLFYSYLKYNTIINHTSLTGKFA